jgi:preprotein translocase subunit SecD
MNRRLVASLVGIVVLAVAAISTTLIAGDRPSLGLDLQGGASVTLQPEGSFDATALDVAVEIIRSRVDSIGVAEPEIIRQGDTVVINLPGVKDQQRALDIVGRTGDVQLRGVLQAGVAPSGDTGAPTDATTPTTDSTPSTESTPTTVSPSTSIDGAAPTGPGGSRRIAADTTIPAITPVAPATVASTDTTVPGATTGTTSPTPDTATPDTTSAGDGATNPLDTLPAGVDVLQGRDGLSYLVAPAGATGQVFDNTASAGIESGQWTVVVGLRRGAEGEDLWNALTTLCYNRDELCPTGQVAIVLDGEVISAPVVQEPVFTGGQVQITGNFTETEARDLAKILEFGAVPVKFAVSQVQTVSPTLGGDSLRAAIISGLIGLLLVFLLMVAYYRLVAVVVFVGLAVSIALQFSVITYLSKTNGLALSLSGIAGIIVSVGIAVDSYIVFFERLKDELVSGRTLRNSALRSFEGAWRTVLAADTVSFLAAAVLWWLTVGSVRGFAFFLGLATLADVIIVWFFTRPAMLLLARSRFMANRRVLGVSVPTTAASTVSTGGAS